MSADETEDSNKDSDEDDEWDDDDLSEGGADVDDSKCPSG